MLLLEGQVPGQLGGGAEGQRGELGGQGAGDTFLRAWSAISSSKKGLYCRWVKKGFEGDIGGVAGEGVKGLAWRGLPRAVGLGARAGLGLEER